MATTKVTLVDGTDRFTLSALVEKAAQSMGLTLNSKYGYEARSVKIKEYRVDQELRGRLKDQGITELVQHSGFTLQTPNGSRWNFVPPDKSEEKFDPRLYLLVGFRLSAERRGILMYPYVDGNCGSPADSGPSRGYLAMFKALVDADPEAPAVAKEVAACDVYILIGWNSIGLGGIRQMRTLFAEFAQEKKAILDLGRGHNRVFDPDPYPHRVGVSEPGDEIFIAEPAHGAIFDAWQGQLEEYRQSLVRVY